MSVECGPRACNFIPSPLYLLINSTLPPSPSPRSSSLLHTRLLPLSCLYLYLSLSLLSLSIFVLKATFPPFFPHSTISLLDRSQWNSIKRATRYLHHPKIGLVQHVLDPRMHTRFRLYDALYPAANYVPFAGSTASNYVCRVELVATP